MTQKQSSTHSTISSPPAITATINSSVYKDSQESAVAEILDLEGNAINMDDQLDRGVISKRSGNIVHRKVGNKNLKAALKPMEGRKITQTEFARIIREPWCNIKVNQATSEKRKLSGQNKEGHGLGRVNDRLFCHLCNVPIVKVSQHLVTNKH